jgi:hypothetical protein
VLHAAGMVLERRLPIAPEHAEAVSKLTGTPYEIQDYSDAAHGPAHRALAGDALRLGLRPADRRCRQLRGRRWVAIGGVEGLRSRRATAATSGIQLDDL